MIDEKQFNTEWTNSAMISVLPFMTHIMLCLRIMYWYAKHLASNDATQNEKNVYQAFLSKQKAVFRKSENSLPQQIPGRIRIMTKLWRTSSGRRICPIL